MAITLVTFYSLDDFLMNLNILGTNFSMLIKAFYFENVLKKMKDERLLRIVLKMWCFIGSWFFERFRNNSLRIYGLCPSHYLSAPDLSWNVMLHMKNVELELTLDPEMYIFFEKGRGGGVF